ncbi:MAG: tRNA preQ1(34) S-adenosylmethionine ribosyltransferase-isomerase QueA [Anaerolineales bacterium]|nr:tRNA preQ1(34) S-adenosylmethionine ribosyltransferase-isomerase QueA [Anaerolineales bacterium]
MKTSDFDYHLPPELIAQTPVEPRDASRLLVLQRTEGQISHAYFRDLGQWLHPGDLLVLNQTRVIPARVYAQKVPTGGRIELLLLRRRDERTWEVLVGGKGMRPGKRLQIPAGPQGEILEDLGGPRRLVRFDSPIEALLEQVGQMPLPPYIHTALEQPERYQTVYARQAGSAAAPTAGLHFTPGLIADLQQQGIELARVTLHVGLDTFAPVTEAHPQEHAIHTEWCQLTATVAEQINRARQRGGRVIAVGTTSVRTLETAARYAAPGETVAAFEGQTDLFILPGYRFRVVDVMITNFHLPRSTLIMLVSAFAGRQETLEAYELAKQAGYRFYSFGDAMLII